MKKILLITALFCISLTSNIYAQCTLDPAVVTANMPGLFPTPADGIDTGMVGAAYVQDFTIIIPADTTVAIPPAPPTTVSVNTVTITGIGGLPPGLAYACDISSCIWPGNTNGCFRIDGTPTQAGTFTVTVTVVANVTALGFPVDAPPQDIVYTLEVTGTGGCVMTVSATSTDETGPGLNDGTGTATAVSGTVPYTYMWSDGQLGTMATGLAPGSYQIIVWDGAGCTDFATVTIVGFPTGIGTVNAIGFEVYPVTPNPSIDQTEIRFTTPDYRDVSLSVHNMIGAVVISRQIYAEKGMNIVTLNADDMRPGVYFVTLTDGVSTSTRRMVVGSK